ncbi:fermentation-respiration switch protein FrsA (DUF1100 family) [Paenibacillus shirakamiensis]|uniref:Fermentation-respiration switch protein FrsA (DUF1100 family) n=1 Tax=Paenibacillus shirakamiensis TaxID=1265935 RepID=A0ABS4JIZ7_9BACL|nr:alpha/beta hydrolase [Paenibacillus shirakamiensis]MBP2001682.1 fermentation-respiration switch protein FrsA (DUF1100 family) [Paenibacillus shirakamiensis]
MVYTIVVTIILLILLVLIAMTRFGFRQITQMKLQTSDSLFKFMEDAGVYSKERFDILDKSDVSVTTRDGLTLHGYAISSHPNSNKWVIIVHGYTASLEVSAQFGGLFEDIGFNVLLVDQRRHGRSQGSYTTYGFHEKYDIESWVNWIISHAGTDVVIGLHGQSLGGGTVLEYLTIADPRVHFVIADCPYSDLTQLIRYQLSVLNKVPTFPFLPLINNQLERKAGFRLHQVSPIKSVQNTSMPVMFIHGTEDKYVPTRMSQDMYKVKAHGLKKLLLVNGAIHGNAYSVDPVRYSHEVQAFVTQTLEEHVSSPVTPLNSSNSEETSDSSSDYSS